MIKQLIDNIRDKAENISGIGSFRYEGEDLINAQPNNAVIQVIVENDVFIDYLVTKDLIKIGLNIDILDSVTSEKDELSVHNKTFKIGVVLLKLIEDSFRSNVKIDDYNFLFVSRFTDDELSGVRMSVDFTMPSPITYCNISDYLDAENKYQSVKDFEITINKPQIDVDELDINPIKLKRNE